MTPLEKGQLGVLRVQAAIAAVGVTAVSLFPQIILMGDANLPFGVITGPVALIAITLALVMPGRRYRRWGYQEAADDLTIWHGVMTRFETVVPLFRVQHIDIGQGPIERLFGVNRLILHTAGTQHSKVELPGLSRETAERLRDEIRARVGKEAP